MHRIVYWPKFCSLETWVGQLNRIMENKERLGKKLCFSLRSVLKEKLKRYLMTIIFQSNVDGESYRTGAGLSKWSMDETDNKYRGLNTLCCAFIRKQIIIKPVILSF